jgi:hypothetical protein
VAAVRLGVRARRPGGSGRRSERLASRGSPTLREADKAARARAADVSRASWTQDPGVHSSAASFAGFRLGVGAGDLRPGLGGHRDRDGPPPASPPVALWP